MQTVINGLTISGTPIEMAELAKFIMPEMEKPQADPKPEPKKKVQLDMGKVKALRKAGWTLEKIADEMGVSSQTIATRLKGAE